MNSKHNTRRNFHQLTAAHHAWAARKGLEITPDRDGFGKLTGGYCISAINPPAEYESLYVHVPAAKSTPAALCGYYDRATHSGDHVDRFTKLWTGQPRDLVADLLSRIAPPKRITNANATIDGVPFVEAVRQRANAGDPDAPLDFYTPAIALGATPELAEQIDTDLTARVMRARGAI